MIDTPTPRRPQTDQLLERLAAEAGLLAGSIGALAYTVACVNDGAAFVAIWYSASVVAAGCLGALAGPRWLAW